MTTNAVAAYGATFSWNGTTLAELINIGGPSIKINTIDVTAHEATSAFQEFKAGLADGGEITIEGNFYPGDTSGQKAFIDDAIARTQREVIITGPSGSAYTFTFNGIVTSLDFSAPVADKLGFSATVKATGVPTLSVTASTGMSALTGIEENGETALDFLPDFAIGTFLYSVAVNTASTYVKLTPTAASHTITIINSFDSSEQTVSSGAQSGELDLGAANTVTLITVKVQESGKVAKNYKIYITRAAS